MTAAYEAVKYFKRFLEFRDFHIATDHKPLIYAFNQKSDKASPRQVRQLSFISQFTTAFKYLQGNENVVADSLSRVDTIRLATDVNFVELSIAQKDDVELQSLLKTGSSYLNLCRMLWGTDQTAIFCDLSGEIIRPFIPLSLRKRVFETFHNSAHPSGKVTDRIIRKSYVWPGMNSDIKKWCRGCLDCQKSKVSRHTILQPSNFMAPAVRFRHVHMDITQANKTLWPNQ